MASVTITESWTDPTASLTDGSTYVVQNKTSGVVQFYEGGGFDPTTNDGDGILLVSLHDGGSGNSDMLWKFDASNAVRMRVLAAIPNTTNAVEFAEAA